MMGCGRDQETKSVILVMNDDFPPSLKTKTFSLSTMFNVIYQETLFVSHESCMKYVWSCMKQFLLIHPKWTVPFPLTNSHSSTTSQFPANPLDESDTFQYQWHPDITCFYTYFLSFVTTPLLECGSCTDEVRRLSKNSKLMLNVSKINAVLVGWGKHFKVFASLCHLPWIFQPVNMECSWILG